METMTSFQARIAGQNANKPAQTPRTQNINEKQKPTGESSKVIQEIEIKPVYDTDVKPVYDENKVSVYETKQPVQKIEISIKEADAKSDGAKKAAPEAEIKTEKPPYRDPLMKWPARGLAYTNEIGAAISDIAPTAGTLLWIPALLYIGADTFDKYKNDETQYNPSIERGAQEAIFQTCASVVMPTAAVKLGQRTVSSLSRVSEDGLSALAKEDVLKRSLEYIKTHDMGDFAGDADKYKKGLVTSVLDARQNAKNAYDSKSIFKKALAWINPFHDPDNIAFAKEDKLSDFASKQADKIMNMGKTLMEGKKPDEMSDKLFKEFQNRKVDLQKTNPQDFVAKAAKSILEDQHGAQIFKNKLMKTLGGFIALGLLIKPIDLFVEKFIIKKTVEPGIDYLQVKFKGRVDKDKAEKKD